MRKGFIKKINRLSIINELHFNNAFNSFKAVDTFLDRLVVLKILHPEFILGNIDRTKKIFFEQTNIIGKLNHPYIAKIYDITEDDGFVYIAREFVEGEHLATQSNNNNWEYR